MLRKLLMIAGKVTLMVAGIVTLLFVVFIFGRFHHHVEYQYKDAKETFSWGAVRAGLYTGISKEKQYSLGIGIITNNKTKGVASITNVRFKGMDTGHILLLKDSSIEDITDKFTSINFPNVSLPFDNYTVTFDLAMTLGDREINQKVSLSLKKDYREYYYSIWDTWMGI